MDINRRHLCSPLLIVGGFLAVFFLLGEKPAFAESKEKEESKAPPAAEGKLHVYTQPEGATLFLDGEMVEKGTPAKLKVAAGRHEIRVEMEGYEPETRTVEVVAGQLSSLMLILRPVPEHAAQDRKQANQGGYLLAGPLHFRIITSDIMLGSSVTTAEKKLMEIERTAPGIAIQLRYITPIGDRGFLIVDTNYLDARLSIHNVRFPKPQAEVDKIELLLFRGGIEFSLAPNIIDYFVPYVGAGLHYTFLRDTLGTKWLGADNQEEFLGYTLKAGFFWNSRYHFIFGAEYQYHWSYPLEDYMVIGFLGYQF